MRIAANRAEFGRAKSTLFAALATKEYMPTPGERQSGTPGGYPVKIRVFREMAVNEEGRKKISFLRALIPTI
jgi:hypothetical protein